MKSQSSCFGEGWSSFRANNFGQGLKVPPASSLACPVAAGSKYGVIRRAALQKTDTSPISMIKQRNFDCGAGFCPPLLSARFTPSTPSAAIQQDLVSGMPGTSED